MSDCCGKLTDKEGQTVALIGVTGDVAGLTPISGDDLVLTEGVLVCDCTKLLEEVGGWRMSVLLEDTLWLGETQVWAPVEEELTLTEAAWEDMWTDAAGAVGLTEEAGFVLEKGQAADIVLMSEAAGWVFAQEREEGLSLTEDAATAVVLAPAGDVLGLVEVEGWAFGSLRQNVLGLGETVEGWVFGEAEAETISLAELASIRQWRGLVSETLGLAEEVAVLRMLAPVVEAFGLVEARGWALVTEGAESVTLGEVVEMVLGAVDEDTMSVTDQLLAGYGRLGYGRGLGYGA